MSIQHHDVAGAPEATAPQPAEKKTRALAHFLREVQVELKKTDWPSRDDMKKFVLVILVVMVIVTIFLWLADRGAGFLIQKLLS